MSKIREYAEKASGRQMTEEEALAFAKEQADKMHDLREPLTTEVVDFINAMREKYGHGTIPPLTNGMAFIIGTILGKIPDTHVLGEAAMEVFSEFNRGTNMAMAITQAQNNVAEDDRQAIAFNVTIAIGTPEELRERIAADKAADQAKADAAPFVVKAPVLH